MQVEELPIRGERTARDLGIKRTTYEDVEKDVSPEAAAEESDQESGNNDVTSDNATVQTEETNEENTDGTSYSGESDAADDDF